MFFELVKKDAADFVHQEKFGLKYSLTYISSRVAYILFSTLLLMWIYFLIFRKTIFNFFPIFLRLFLWLWLMACCYSKSAIRRCESLPNKLRWRYKTREDDKSFSLVSVELNRSYSVGRCFVEDMT